MRFLFMDEDLEMDEVPPGGVEAVDVEAANGHHLPEDAISFGDEEHEQVDELEQERNVSFKSGTGSFSRYSSRCSSIGEEEKKEASGIKENLWLAYHTLGVVFGDLGTTPLYVFPTIQLDSSDERDYLGVLSIIFWSLMLVGLLKYVMIVLQADDHGEGGTFALYSLLCRHANAGKYVGKHYGRMESDASLSFFGAADHVYVHSAAKKFLETNKTAQKTLLLCVMMGTCMVIGDGVLTPAISVLSAAGGIRSEFPQISQTTVVMIACAILVALFVLQSVGTNNVGFIFSPIMLIWFASTTGIGIFNIMQNYPGVFKGLSPYYAVHFFLKHGKEGWKMLGALVLCITGVEAMFADLGHFNKQSIQMAFTMVVFPALIITYAGETAYLIKHPENRSDAFFKSIPRIIYWPMFMVATLAAIVASQALISATFSVLKQSMSLGCFPRVKLVHTSSEQEGQIYSPDINYVLLALCLAVVLGFQDGSKIGNAYGVAVILVMLMTTFLVALVMLVVWRTSIVWIVLFITVFGAVEIIYLSAILGKLVMGGWVPFAIAAVFLTVSLVWNYGRRTKYEFEAKNRITSHDFTSLCSELRIKRVPGMSLFYSNLVHGGLPPLMIHYMKTVGSLHDVVIFLTIRVVPVKSVLHNERLFVARSGVKGLFRCVVRYGYMDVISMESEEFLEQLIQGLTVRINSDCEEITTGKAASETDVTLAENKAQTEMEELDAARVRGAVHVVGHSKLKTKSRNWFKRFIINKFYRVLHECTRSAVYTFKIPSSHLLELAMVYETG